MIHMLHDNVLQYIAQLLENHHANLFNQNAQTDNCRKHLKTGQL